MGHPGQHGEARDEQGENRRPEMAGRKKGGRHVPGILLDRKMTGIRF